MNLFRTTFNALGFELRRWFDTAMEKKPEARRPNRVGVIFAQVLFGFCNLIILSFSCVGVGLMLGPVLVSAWAAGRLPFAFVLAWGVSLVVPICSVVWGLRRWSQPKTLLSILFGFELPVLGIAFVRLFLANQLTWAQTHYYASAIAGVTTFAVALRWKPKPVALRAVRAFTMSALAVVSLHLGALLGLLYVPPFVARVSQVLWEGMRTMSRLRLEEGLLGAGILTIVLCASVPAILMTMITPWLYAEAWRESVHELFRAKVGSRAGSRGPLGRWAWALSALGFAFGFVPLVLAASDRAPELNPQVPPTEEERAAWDVEARVLRTELLDAYLARYRYQGERARSSSALARFWRESFGGRLEDYVTVSRLHDVLGALWLYPGDFDRDATQARELYATWLDADIERAERKAIVRARNSTIDREQAAASLTELDARAVEVTERRHSVATHGDWAELELYERYVNRTDELQEVVYSFVLPEGAVVTGLWLGVSPDKARADRFEIAPRGAARRVYEQQVRQRVDPALLEQTGPRQYRLRVFPIPVAEFDPSQPSGQSDPAPMHLWLQVRVLAAGDQFPVPSLLEARNAFWTDGEWWPSPRERAKPARARRIQIDSLRRVRAIPESEALLPTLEKKNRLLVAIDRSLSMAQHKEALQKATEQLRGHDVDWVLTAPHILQEAAFSVRAVDPWSLVFFGGQSPSELVVQALEFANKGHDAVLILTDRGAVDLEQYSIAVEPDSPPIPLFFVHLGERLPIAYETWIRDRMARSGGGAVFSVEAALADIAMHDLRVSRLGGYRWSLVDGQADREIEPDGFSAFAAARAIEIAARDPHAQLDVLHTVAKKFEIVSPYSSMIVLVNDAQREQLAEAAEETNRFAVQEGQVQVSGVPEPEHWILLLVAAAMLGWTHFKKRACV